MKPPARTLVRAVVFGALGAAAITWAIAWLLSSIVLQRAHHATLDAASAAVSAAVDNAASDRVVERLARLAPSLAAWNVSAAAFDRSGTFLAGDDALRGDGLPVGQQPAPPAARQVAIVPTRDGYVLLVPNPRSAGRFRFWLLLWFLGSLLVAVGAAYAGGAMWGRERARGELRLRDYLRSIAAGARPMPLPPDDDPLYGQLSSAAGAAVERLERDAASRAEAEERLRTFLGEAGHELRTPLAIAVGYTGILKRGGIGDAALAERVVNDISAEHERLQRLVERILQLARLDAVPAQEGATADAVAVTNEAIALVRPLDPERSVDVEAPAAAFAAIAADDLRDALRNLLENAIRYAPGAPIQVRIAIASDVSISVIDAGPGMDAFTGEHAFDRFFRGADRGSIPGTGLGLAIVRRITERAHGNAVLRSTLGQGTTVELRIPRALSCSDALVTERART